MIITINRIVIQNVKGIQRWEHIFDGLCSNKVNLFVAPNGFGKSTITTAFQAAAHGRMNLGRNDFFQGDETNVPLLEIEYSENGKTEAVV